MPIQHIIIENIEIQVTWKAIKNIHLRVTALDGKVTMSCPKNFKLPEVKKYLETKLAWIQKAQEKFKAYPKPQVINFDSGESHYFLGNSYLLNIEKGNSAKVNIDASRLDLYAPEGSSKEKKAAILDNFYRVTLEKIIAEMLEKHSAIMQLPKPSFAIRKMKARWGSCLIHKQHLMFNLELAKKPKDCIELVVVHELVHLFERYHNKRFYALMTKFMPNWQVYQKQLNEMSL